jgi:hypothetical protein
MSKGSVVASCRPLFVLQPLVSARELPACGRLRCGRAAGGLQIALAKLIPKRKRRRGDVDTTKSDLSLLEFACKRGCGMVYCSAECSAVHEQEGHLVMCPSCSPAAKEFRKFALSTSETLLMAARVLAEFPFDYLNLHIGKMRPPVPWWLDGKADLSLDASNWGQQVEDGWTLLQVCLTLGQRDCNDGTKSLFFCLLQLIEEQCLPAYLPSPLVDYCLSLQTTENMKLKREFLNDVLGCDDVSSEVDLERALGQIIQSAESAFPPLNLLVFPPKDFPSEDCAIGHSCCPGFQVEARMINNAEGRAYLELCLVSLRTSPLPWLDVGCAEAKVATVALVSVLDSYSARESAMRSKFHDPNFLCVCLRCEGERGGYEKLSQTELSALASQALEEGRCEIAAEIWHILEGRGEINGSGSYRLGVALLALGRFAEARDVWRRAAVEFPNHPELQAQSDKEHSCDTSSTLLSRDDIDRIEFETLLPHGAFLSTTPVLSSVDCEEIINLAEAEAKERGGWATARHYAVPTTDLPMYSIPMAVPKLRVLLKRILPLMAKQFLWKSLKGVYV